MADNNILDINSVTESDFDKIEIFHIYKLWSSLPPLMRMPPQQKDGTRPKPREFAMGMGIDDESILDLVELVDNKSFGLRYNVHPNTLTRWKKFIKANGLNGLPVMKTWAEDMSRNMIMSMYNHAMKKGNPLIYKAWFQIVNDWKETSKVEHTLQPITEIEHEDYDPLKHGIKEAKLGEERQAETGLELSQG